MSVHFLTLPKIHRFEALVLQAALSAASAGTREDDWLSGFSDDEKDRAIEECDRLLGIVNQGVAKGMARMEAGKP